MEGNFMSNKDKREFNDFSYIIALIIKDYWVLFVIAILWFICAVGTAFYTGTVLGGILLAIFIPIGVIGSLALSIWICVVIIKAFEKK